MFLGEIFGPDLIIIVIVVVVILFGGAAIPKLARNLGSAKTEFEKGIKAGKDANASDTSGEKATSAEPDKKSSETEA